LTSRIVDFQTNPDRYRHWAVQYDDAIAIVSMDVDEQGGLFGDYELKLNSYDLGVDIEPTKLVTLLKPLALNLASTTLPLCVALVRVVAMRLHWHATKST